MKAIKVVEVGKAEIQDVPVPELRDDYVLIKVLAVALNPTDWKHIHVGPATHPGTTAGCDFVGVVQEVGPNVTKPHKKGDHICGFANGGNALRKSDGCFAEYAIVKGDTSIKVPAGLSDEEAATLGIGITTVGQGLYQSLKLPQPGHGNYDGWLLVYGGSTATGSLAIQYGKLSGARVVTTCSPRNFEFVKSLGAEAAFDYNEKDVGTKIREYTKDSLVKVFDTISENGSTQICEDAISSNGGEISSLLPAESGRKDVENKSTLGYTEFGEPLKKYGHDIPAMPEHFEFASKFWELSAQLLADGKVKVHPPDVRPGGLAGIFGGLDDLRLGKVSGKKIVYRIADA